MFSGEAVYGAGDTPSLIGELNRNDVVYAGVIGNVAGIEDLVATAVEKAAKRTSIIDRLWRAKAVIRAYQRMSGVEK
jgi:hypothetical protein